MPGVVTCWVVEQRLSLLVINIEWIIEAADMRADGWGDLLDGNGVAARCGGVVDLGHGAQILTDDAHRSLAFVPGLRVSKRVMYAVASRWLDGTSLSSPGAAILRSMSPRLGHVHVDLPWGT